MQEENESDAAASVDSVNAAALENQNVENHSADGQTQPDEGTVDLDAAARAKMNDKHDEQFSNDSKQPTNTAVEFPQSDSSNESDPEEEKDEDQAKREASTIPTPANPHGVVPPALRDYPVQSVGEQNMNAPTQLQPEPDGAPKVKAKVDTGAEEMEASGMASGRRLLAGTKLKMGDETVTLVDDAMVTYPGDQDEQKFVAMSHFSGNPTGETRFKYNGFGARLPLIEQVDEPEELPEFIRGLTETEAASFGVSREDWKRYQEQ